MPPDGEILRRVQFGDKSLEALFAVQRSEAMVHIALAAQFDGHRKAAHGDRETLAETLLQLPPH